MALNTLNFFKGTLIKAFYYIAHADGKIDEKEVSLGSLIIKNEKISDADYDNYMQQYKKEAPQKLYESLIRDLKQLNKDQQVTIIAYMSNIANSNGFMDPAEWKIIYHLYKHELHLNLEEVLNRQKQLPPFRQGNQS